METVQTLRQTWEDMPAALTSRINAQIGEVVTAVTQPKGFSSGVAARVVTSTGGRAFVKAADRRRNVGTVALHRREAEILGTLPSGIPAPKLIGEFDDGDWFALIVEDIEGRHPDERQGDTERVLDALAELPRITGSHTLPIAADEEVEALKGWQRLTDAVESDLPAWARDNHDVLISLAEGAANALRGDWLLHCDSREDNMLIEPDCTVRIIDWPWASVGCRWFDSLCYLLDARMRGEQIDAERIVDQHPIFADASRDDVTAVLASLAGQFLAKARRPAPPFMPTLRAFQRSEGLTALAWVRDRVEREHATS